MDSCLRFAITGGLTESEHITIIIHVYTCSVSAPFKKLLEYRHINNDAANERHIETVTGLHQMPHLSTSPIQSRLLPSQHYRLVLVFEDASVVIILPNNIGFV